MYDKLSVADNDSLFLYSDIERKTYAEKSCRDIDFILRNYPRSDPRKFFERRWDRFRGSVFLSRRRHLLRIFLRYAKKI